MSALNEWHSVILCMLFGQAGKKKLQRVLTDSYGGLVGLHFWGGKWKLLLKLILSLLRHTCVSWLREVLPLGCYTFRSYTLMFLLQKLHLWDITPSDVTPLDDTPLEETPSEVTPSEVTPLEVTPSKVTPSEVTPSDVTPSEVTPLGCYIFRYIHRIFHHRNIEPSTASVS